MLEESEEMFIRSPRGREQYGNSGYQQQGTYYEKKHSLDNEPIRTAPRHQGIEPLPKFSPSRSPRSGVQNSVSSNWRSRNQSPQRQD
jgi:hypothetical protein